MATLDAAWGAGIRYFDFDTVQDAARVMDFLSVPGPGPGPTFKANESGTTTRFNVAYDLTDDLLAYIQVAEGFRAALDGAVRWEYTHDESGRPARLARFASVADEIDQHGLVACPYLAQEQGIEDL